MWDVVGGFWQVDASPVDIPEWRGDLLGLGQDSLCTSLYAAPTALSCNVETLLLDACKCFEDDSWEEMHEQQIHHPGSIFVTLPSVGIPVV